MNFSFPIIGTQQLRTCHPGYQVGSRSGSRQQGYLESSEPGQGQAEAVGGSTEQGPEENVSVIL